MSRCDCSAYPHDDWCSDHPRNVEIDDLKERVSFFESENEKLQKVVDAVRVWAEPIKASSVMESAKKKADKDSKLYAALKELES